MKTRIITGLVGASLVTLLICYGPLWLILATCVFAAVLSYLEFDALFFAKKSTVRQVQMVVLVVAGVIAVSYGQIYGWMALWAAFIILALGKVFRSDRRGDFAEATRELSLETLAYVYLVCLFGFIHPIAQFGRSYVFFIFFFVFIGDTAAYFVGRTMGRHLLVPKLSPKKTVEGAVGALVVSCLAMLVAVYYLFEANAAPNFLFWMMLFAPIGSVLAQFGDLFESMLKRSQAKKDSGTFLPGHGGMLDRVDGLALFAPVFYFFLTFLLGAR